MNIKLARYASVEPLLGADLATDIARETFGLIRRAESEVEGVIWVVVVGDREGLGGAKDVKVKVASGAVVAEAVATAVTGVAVEDATGVGGGGEEGEGVEGVGGVGDEVGELGAG